MTPLLQLKNITKEYRGVPAISDVSIELEAGRVHAILGENGAGKSTLTKMIAGAVAPTSGEILLDGRPITLSSPGEALRHGIAMVFQEPMTALNPLQTIGQQVAETIRIHEGASPQQALERAEAVLEQCELPAAQVPLSRYPHQLSGGQRQRVVIAMAIAMLALCMRKVIWNALCARRQSRAILLSVWGQARSAHGLIIYRRVCRRALRRSYLQFVAYLRQVDTKMRFKRA